MDGFVKTDDGRFAIVPLKKIAGVSRTNSATKKSGEKWSGTKRKVFTLKRLTFADQDFPEQSSKKAKVERTVRKELFKVPQTKTERRLSNNKSLFNKRYTTSKKNNKVPQIQINPVDDSPIIDAKKETSHKKISNVKTVLFPMSAISEEQRCMPLENLSVPCGGRTPDSLKEELEFLELEKTLASAKKPNVELEAKSQSPMASVCALLENTQISTSRKTNTVFDEIRSLLEEDKKQFEQYKQQRQITFDRINALLESKEEDKENQIRRSGRIAAKSSTKKFAVSPAMVKDLRKSTLNNNLTKKLQFNSPTRKAMDLYNSMRDGCTFLCTPKLDKMALNVGQTSVTRSLSRRIQKQCLLLQDTPKP